MTTAQNTNNKQNLEKDKSSANLIIRAVRIFKNFMSRLLVGVRFHEGTKEELKPVLIKFLGRAKFSIRVVSGELPLEFYTDKEVLRILESVHKLEAKDKEINRRRRKPRVGTESSELELKEETGILEFVCTRTANEKSVEALENIGSTIHQLEQRQHNHFIVIDNRDVAFEDGHDSVESIRTWRIAYNSSVADAMVDKFMVLSRQASDDESRRNQLENDLELEEIKREKLQLERERLEIERIEMEVRRRKLELEYEKTAKELGIEVAE